MNKFDFYKELYFQEISRKDKLDNSVSTPITIISAVIASIYFLISNFEFNIEIILSVVFLVLMGLTILFLIISIIQLLILYNNLSSGHKYSYFPFVTDLDKYDSDLQRYYEEIGEDKNLEHLEYQNYLKSNTIKHVDFNTVTNDSRSLTLYKSKRNILFTLLFLFLSLIPFGINYINKPEKIKKIELINSTNSLDTDNIH